MARILTFNHKIINPGNNRYFGSFGSGPGPTPPTPPEPTVYDVILTTDGHGSITANPMSGSKDTLITLSNTPNQNYVFSKYTLNNVDLAGNTFLMPEADANVKGWFEADMRTITVTQPSHGTITAPASAQVGSTVTLSCTPDTGYVLQYFTVNGSQIQGNSFVMPASNVTVSASIDVVPETYTFYTNNTESKELYTSRISTDVPEGKTVKSYVLEMELNNNPTQLYLTTDGETWEIIGTRGDSYGHSGTWDLLKLKDYNYSLDPTITYMNTSLVKNNDIRYYYSSHVGYTWCYTVTGINPLWTDGWHKLKIVLSSSDFSTSATVSIYRDDVLLLTGNLTADFPLDWPFDRINLTGSGNTKKIRNVNYYAVVE